MPKPPRSLRSETSNNERLEPKLLRAVEANDVVQAKAVIDEAISSRQWSELLLSIGLIRACDRNLLDVARFLLLAGANANHISGSGNKLPNLRRAAELGHIDIAKLLVENNADLEARDKKGRTALMTAAWKVSLHLLHVLLPLRGVGNRSSMPQQDTRSSLWVLVRLTFGTYQGHLNIVELLLVKGAKVNEVDYKRRNVLHNIAAGPRDERTSGTLGLKIASHLLQAGVDVDATDELGRTALHWSTVTDNVDLMKLLLTTRFGGASPKARTNAVDKRMKTPLHLAAASHEKQHLAGILLQHGADVHARYLRHPSF